MRFDYALTSIPVPAPDTPPESPLEMPAQAVSARRINVRGETDGRWRLAQLVIAAGMVTCLAVASA